VIDNATGQIVGNTATFEPTNTAYEDPFTACRDSDHERDIRHRSYHEQVHPLCKGEPGYLVYLATDEVGVALVPHIACFSALNEIEMVRMRCRLACCVWYIEDDD